MKRTISLLLTMLIALNIFSFSRLAVSAADKTESPAGANSGKTGDCAWTLNNGVLTISGSGKMEDYDDDSRPIWYWSRNDLCSVIIEQGVTNIGRYAFYECAKLTSVTIGTSVTNIGYSAFRDCTSLTSIDIPDSVTSVGYSAFDNCESLASVTIPDSLTVIGGYAFRGCSSLTGIDIPDSITSIGESAFSDCLSLTDIYIPDSVMSIGAEAFSDTAWYNDQPDGIVYAGKVLYKYKGECPSEIIIREDTSGIAGSAFCDCSALTSISIPDSVTNIGKGAFFGCINLGSVFIPDSVTTIETTAFGYYSHNSIQHNLSDFSIIGKKVSRAQSYAEENGLTFKRTFGICPWCGTLSIDEENAVALSSDPADCTADGYEDVRCTECAKEYRAVIPALGHDKIEDALFDATCTEKGEFYWHCGRCGEIGEDELPALGHSHKAVITPPTCTESGYTTYICRRCNDSYVSDSVEPLGHDYMVTVIPPTCTDDGYTEHKCSRCGDTYSTDTVSALGHDLRKTSVTPPTCTEEGYTAYTCSRCGGSYKGDIIEATGHSGAIEIKRQPTATQQGVLAVNCEVCSLKANVILPILSADDYTLTKSIEEDKAIYTLKDKSYGTVEFVDDAPEGWFDGGATGDCAWTKEGNALTVSGNGRTQDYSVDDPAPWKDSGITEVFIENGVTHVGDYAFYNCAELTYVSIPDSVTSIGQYALGYHDNDKKIDGFTIRGCRGSAAEGYAKDHGFKFVDIDEKPSDPTGKAILGDADGDGEVTILDATTIQRHLVGLHTNSFNEKASDADEDKEVTILDATDIRRRLAGLPTTGKNIGKSI